MVHGFMYNKADRRIVGTRSLEAEQVVGECPDPIHAVLRHRVGKGRPQKEPEGIGLMSSLSDTSAPNLGQTVPLPQPVSTPEPQGRRRQLLVVEGPAGTPEDSGQSRQGRG